jgi:pseudouridine-5'-phosphate glycosidase
VIVVSAGAKAILDIPKTLEALETRGVPVVAFGQDEMPAFWSRDSGLLPLCGLMTPPRSPGSSKPGGRSAAMAAC